MEAENKLLIEEAKKAAIEVLLHNAKGPYQGLPRTAGWGYPEPYTRDLLISSLGIAASKNNELTKSLEKVLVTLAKNQSIKGQIPSLVHDKTNLGASDTTPLFLFATAVFRQVIKAPAFLQDEVENAMVWMEYQSPKNNDLVTQQPTSDWRDEQWVLGYGLYVNALVYAYRRLLGDGKRAANMLQAMEQWTFRSDPSQEGFLIKDKPYFAFWSYKVYSNERFDLLGNSLAILSGLAKPSRARAILSWVEQECEVMKTDGTCPVDLSPNFFPFIQPGEPDWLPRYAEFNLPGDYHNGGLWPFISGFQVAALVAAEEFDLAEEKLMALTRLIKKSRDSSLQFGFNEWYKAQNGMPMGQDWQTWTASNYLYAAQCVQEKRTPFFDRIRNAGQSA